MKTIVCAAAIVLAAGSLAAQNLKGDYYLDIPGHTYSPVTPAAPYVPHFTGLVARSHQTYVTSLKLTLVSVDISNIVFGDYFIYEVLIENTGKAPVTLPWSPNHGAFAQPVRRTPPGFRSGLLYLDVESSDEASSRLAMLDAQSLLGSQEVPGSLRELAPGRTARIRAPAQWSATMPEGRDAVLRQPDGIVRVRAVFLMDRAVGEDPSIIGVADEVPLTRSTNTITVRATPRRLVD